MKRILAPILLVVLLFPTLALGEEVTMDDLVRVGDDLLKSHSLWVHKSTGVPLTGKVTGKNQRSFRDGERDGLWVIHYDNGQLHYKGTFKNNREDGPWVIYHDKGQLWSKGTLKNGKEVGPWVSYWDNGQLWMKGTYKCPAPGQDSCT